MHAHLITAGRGKLALGFTMIELLVALLLFAVSIIGFSALQGRAIQESFDTRQRSLALWRANGLIDRMSVNGTATAITAYSDAINDDANCAAAPPATCSTSGGNRADDCTDEELAEFDVWNEFCSPGATLEDSLIDFNASLICDTACAPGADIRLTLSWVSKAVDSDASLREGTTDIDGASGSAAREQISLKFRL